MYTTYNTSNSEEAFARVNRDMPKQALIQSDNKIS